MPSRSIHSSTASQASAQSSPAPVSRSRPLQPGQHQHLAHRPAQNLRPQRVPVQRAMDHEARSMPLAAAARPIRCHSASVSSPRAGGVRWHPPSSPPSARKGLQRLRHSGSWIRKLIHEYAYDSSHDRDMSYRFYVAHGFEPPRQLDQTDVTSLIPYRHPQMQLFSDTRSTSVLFDPAQSALDKNPKSL